MAKQNSIAAKQATTVRETKYWQWRTFKSNYQPQLSLTGILPGYSKTYHTGITAKWYHIIPADT
jgi:outer membrane protein